MEARLEHKESYLKIFDVKYLTGSIFVWILYGEGHGH